MQSFLATAGLHSQKLPGGSLHCEQHRPALQLDIAEATEECHRASRARNRLLVSSVAWGSWELELLECLHAHTYVSQALLYARVATRLARSAPAAFYNGNRIR